MKNLILNANMSTTRRAIFDEMRGALTTEERVIPMYASVEGVRSDKADREKREVLVKLRRASRGCLGTGSRRRT